MEILIQQCLNALALGGTYALLALGLAMVFSVLGLKELSRVDISDAEAYKISAAAGPDAPALEAE